MKLTYEQAEVLYNKNLTLYDIYKKPSDRKIEIYLQLKREYNYQVYCVNGNCNHFSAIARICDKETKEYYYIYITYANRYIIRQTT